MNNNTPHDSTNGGNVQGANLRQQAAKETANAIARMKNGAAVADGSDISEAIRHIAAATQKPVNLPRLPTMQVRQPDGSYRTVPMPATWHNPRRREDYEGTDVAQWVDLGHKKPGLVQRVLSWFRR